MRVIVTVLLHLLVPILWGLVSAYLFDRLRGRRERNVGNDSKSSRPKVE